MKIGLKQIAVAGVLSFVIWDVAGVSLGDTLKECQVPDQYKTIQAAVDDRACEIIIVAAGIYEENIKIHRSLTLSGEGYKQTTIRAADSYLPTIVIMGSNIAVTIERVTVSNGNDGIALAGTAKAVIQDSNISDNRGEDVSAGIAAYESTEVTIWHNVFSNNWWAGIWVGDNAQAIITHNRILGNDGSGIELADKAKVRIWDNEITNNSWDRGCGVYAFHGFFSIFTGEVEGARNRISGNEKGELCPPEGPKEGVPWPQDFIGTPLGDPDPPGPREIETCSQGVIALKPNEFVTGQKIGANALTASKESQYCISVADGAKLLAVKLESKGNLDLHIRQGKPVERSGSAIIADYSLPSPDGNEFLIIFAPQLKKGPYFIAVENKENSEQEFTLIATPIFDIQEIEGSADGSADPNVGLMPFLRQYLATQGGMLSLTQYKFDVPSGAKSVTIKLEGPADKTLNLHLRHEKPVEVVADQVAADLSVIGPGGQKGVMLAGTLLKAGRWYIAVESLQTEKVDFKVVVEIEVGTQRLLMVFKREQ